MAIATHFLISYAAEEGKAFRGFAPEVDVILRRYRWPGNVRQLQNVIRNIVVLHDDTIVSHCHLPSPLNTTLNEETMSRLVPSPPQVELAPPSCHEVIVPLADVEREAIERAIAFCDGNIPRAAGLLEVSPSTIYRKKQTWDSMASRRTEYRASCDEPVPA